MTMPEVKEEKREITFRVYRFNPQIDASPFYDEYPITVEKGITVLRALNYIKEHIEPRLSFRSFCQAGICGSCAMRINSVSKLACTTQVWDELAFADRENVILVEPIANLPVIRDLVVDMDSVVGKIEKYFGWVESKMPENQMGKKEFNIAEAEFKLYDAATDCILCASCISECTMTKANKEYITPAVLLKSYRMEADSRDAVHDKRLGVLVSDNGVWDCTHCYRCMEHCVKHIPIMEAIHHIREDAVQKRGLSDTPGAKHAAAFVKDIEKKGRLVESLLPIRTNGLSWTVKNMLPMAFKMTKKGKTPPPPFMVKAVPGIENLRSMLKELKSRGNSNHHK
ncbi:succinate dehydrogenase and fumarate reductase iron-sulfur protein [Chloroherpeton thalassium ATCC 35110]|uniref:Succinate dehydrogenase and fumarate reductase iron-sulfur protein n=1 Tax=Chloroherpeton thalassium (strain ATCC 35110 / GB-78) TaxID=517418 RepID=B3QSZ1_CHLT3|nr:succinate dehydrogenase/fumarate reductase iron-sulfur subunit [Chloroherpeton thalassium]ACF12634.1 succinate dehydrogenase and fumarate reductase iron-sulfur protein [Chloroherpeton thalassium ATCC 35110]